MSAQGWAFLCREHLPGHLEGDHVIIMQKEKHELVQCQGNKKRPQKAPTSCHLAARYSSKAKKSPLAEITGACLRQSIVRAQSVVLRVRNA